MRSSKPIHGDAWPHDMGITVEDRPSALLELLWIREAYELQPEGNDLPPRLTDTPERPTGSVVPETVRIEWQAAWPRIWRAAAAHAGHEPERDLFGQLQQTADGSAERAVLLRRLIGPNWHDEFGDMAFADNAYSVWANSGMESLRAARRTKVRDSPERRDLVALVPAWRAGLTKIVTIPCIGEFTQKLAGHALLVTDATRDDSAAYRRALTSFS